MRLLQLKLKNFKGIKDFTFDTQGGNAAIYADNAVGKTTIFDGFNYLLFDKDSTGKKDFAIKTLDANGQVLHGLSHEVEGKFDIDGKLVTLKKVYAEKWTKKRGSTTATFTGHSVDHFVNGVPVKKGEFDSTIASIASEDIFKLLTSPTFFNEQLHWEKRRKILLDVCGELSDEEVIASDSNLSRLPEILQGRKLEDHRKVIAARRAEINKELDKIPVRVDEATRSLPEPPAVTDKRQYNELISSIKVVRAEKANEIARIESGGEIAEKQRLVAEIETEIIRITNQHESENGVTISKKNTEVSEISSKIMNLEITTLQRDKSKLSGSLDDLKNTTRAMEALRETWHTINNQVFTHEQSDTCPTCGQSLPEEQVQQTREKALADFNLAKSSKLEEVNARGKALKAKNDALQQEVRVLGNAILKTEQEIAAESTKLNELKEEIARLQAAGKPIIGNPAYTKKLQEKESLLTEIANIKTNSQAAIDMIKGQITEIDNEIGNLTADLQKIDLREQGQKRIDELKDQEKKLAAEFERLESELYLCDQFTRTKVKLMDEKINSRFKLARFKMFTENINGGIEPTCLTLLNGVPWESINSAGRIQVGLDIIAALQEHYQFKPPVWIDNRESIVMLPEMDCQVISLVVSGGDKKLRVEVENKNMIREAV